VVTAATFWRVNITIHVKQVKTIHVNQNLLIKKIDVSSSSTAEGLRRFELIGVFFFFFNLNG